LGFTQFKRIHLQSLVLKSYFVISDRGYRSKLWSVVTCLVVTGVLQAAPPNYEDHIRPLFENACFNCHNPDKQKGDLDLTTYSSAMRGGSGGKIAEPGEGADSKIYGVITHTMKPKMPPKGDKLARKDADLIRAWIDGGLLESKSGKAKKSKRPVFVLNSNSSAVKPEGPPPMPQHVLLEPVVISARPSSVADLASSPWAPLLAITGQRQVVLYNTDNLEMVGVLPFDQGQPEVLSFHPSGKYLLAGGGVGGKSGATITWDVETSEILLEAGNDYDSVIAASLRPDLKAVSLGGPGKRVKLWDTQADEQFLSIKKHTDWVTQLAYSLDGVLLASGGRGGDVYIWEADTGNAFHNLRGHKAAITGMAWRADSNLLATVSEDGDMIVWEMNKGKQVKKQGAHKGGVLSVDWNKNGELVTSGRDKKVKLWSSKFKQLKEFPAFDEVVTEVAFSNDGKRVFAASWSGVIMVFDVTSANEVGTLAANPPAIASRIEALLQEVALSKDELAKKSDSLQTAAAKLGKASELQAKVEQQHQDAVSYHKSMIADRAKIESLIKEMGVKGDDLNKRRQQTQHNLVKKRELSNQHNTAVAAARREHQLAEKDGRKLFDSEKRLLNSEQQILKAIEQQSENQKLVAQLAQLRSKLEVQRGELAEHLKFTEGKKLAFLNLSKEQNNPGDQLVLAEAEWKEINEKCTACHAERREMNDNKNALNKKISAQKQLASQLEKNIKPAREEYAKAGEDHHKAKDDFNVILKKESELSASIKHWQAASINAEAIKLSQEVEQLESTLHESMDSFTLVATETREIQDLAMLELKAEELSDLRNEIDQIAPLLLSKRELVAEKKDLYAKMMGE
jgi:hypothetical protein